MAKFWWKKERTHGNLGDYARVKGCDARILCPACQEDFVVYNGNYFCDDYGNGCNWALNHPSVSKRDRLVCDLIGIDYK